MNKTLKSKAQANSKIFSIINLDAVMAKKVAINITELKIIINSIKEDIITSFFENPKILNTKFCYSFTFPWTTIALEITIKPIIIVTAEIRVTAIKTLFKTSVTLFK